MTSSLTVLVCTWNWTYHPSFRFQILCCSSIFWPHSSSVAYPAVHLPSLMLVGLPGIPGHGPGPSQHRQVFTQSRTILFAALPKLIFKLTTSSKLSTQPSLSVVVWCLKTLDWLARLSFAKHNQTTLFLKADLSNFFSFNTCSQELPLVLYYSLSSCTLSSFCYHKTISLHRNTRLFQ